MSQCRTCVVWSAQTGVVAHAVNTGGAVLTPVVLTVIHVHLAEGALETERTCTAEQKKTEKHKHLPKLFKEIKYIYIHGVLKKVLLCI